MISEVVSAAFVLIFSGGTSAKEAPLRVITSLPELAEIVSEIGGDEVVVEALLDGRVDPHFAEAKPTWVLRARNADMVVTTGLGLESAWFDRVVQKSGNASVQRGGRGSCEAAGGVEVLERKAGPVDRSQGDVHPEGNPHFNLSPRALKQAARIVRDCLAKLSPERRAVWDSGQDRFERRMDQLDRRLREILAPVTGNEKRNKIFEYHRELAYFAHDYGLRVLGSVEEKPGLSPSAARLRSVAEELRQKGVRLVVASPFHPTTTLRRLEGLSSVPFVQTEMLSSSKGGIESMIEALARVIVEGTRESQ